jgi:hypothetical protein
MASRAKNNTLGGNSLAGKESTLAWSSDRSALALELYRHRRAFKVLRAPAAACRTNRRWAAQRNVASTVGGTAPAHSQTCGRMIPTVPLVTDISVAGRAAVGDMRAALIGAGLDAKELPFEPESQKFKRRSLNTVHLDRCGPEFSVMIHNRITR